MKKHPNQPAEDREPRKKQMPITLEEYDLIHKLWEQGMCKKAISVKLGRSSGTIVNAIVHLTREEVAARIPKNVLAAKKHSVFEIKTQDLSSLPNTVLFQHNKDYIL